MAIQISHDLLIDFDEKYYSTYKAVEYIVKNEVEGDFIECGVYEGRQIVLMALTLQKLGVHDRHIYLYDTFSGMTQPGIYDEKKHRNMNFQANLKKWYLSKRNNYCDYCYCPIERVKENIFKTGYPKELFHFVPGDVLKTIPQTAPQKISLLRLDTDWYDLTKHELKYLYPKVANQGIVILDDYGSWSGTKKAVDEYFISKNNHPFLLRTCDSERIIIKGAV